MASIIENEFSVFIPSVRRNLQEKDFAEMFCDWGIIDRVDFVEMTPPKQNWVMAFVHFERLYESKNVNEMVYYLETTENGYIIEKYTDLYNDENVYSMYIYKNHSPIPKTTLNIHQLATNFDILKETTEQSLMEANQKILEQEKNIRVLNEKLEEQYRIICMLMGEKYGFVEEKTGN
jgi:hypothetical protein